MLPLALLSYGTHDGLVVPHYLGARDEPWIRAVVDVVSDFVDRTVGERDAKLPERLARVGQWHGVSERVLEGVASVVERTFGSEIRAAIAPRDARRAVFLAAAATQAFDRAGALARASTHSRLPVLELDAALFADVPAARVVVAPERPLAPNEVVERYNLALVQGILNRAEHVVLHVREHVRAVVRFAKLTGLLCTCALDPEGTRLEISGPLTVLRRTTKYGHALAKFLPAALATPRARVEARCLLAGRPARLILDGSERIARTHVLPRDTDSAVERALMRDVRKLDRGWTLVRESSAVQLGTRVVFPDFTLRRADARVLVEIVGFHTPEYLRSKLEALRAIELPMIVCVDDDLGCVDGAAPGDVLRYRGRVDAGALLDRAERVLLRSTSASAR